MTKATRFLISGEVQGVFFRASTREQAQQLGLCGYAKNMSNGRVEVLAIGTLDSIESLANWLSHGPPMAHVECVERQAAKTDAVHLEFTIL